MDRDLNDNEFLKLINNKLPLSELNNVMQNNIADFKKILSVNPQERFPSEKNYSSLIFHLNVEILLNDESTTKISFLLKTQFKNDATTNVLNMLLLFPKEETMYHKIIPKLEALYKDCGQSIILGPKAYRFDRDVGVDYILLEDLSVLNYKNANRIKGLDKSEMEESLTKLAQFHAASACYVEHFGMYQKEFVTGIFSESNFTILKELNNSNAFLLNLKKWKNAAVYYDKLINNVNSDEFLVKRLIENQKVDSSEFNVLNHGDLWTNNILFQHDLFGKIKNSVFIDYQLVKYGSPSNDLYYLILSSASMDIKLTQFDYFIRYYFDKLIENLQLLNYHRPLPKLRNIHMSLLKNGLTAFLIVSKVLPVILLEENQLKLGIQKGDETLLKTTLFQNPKYVQAMSKILPWLNNRGLLDF